MRFLFAGYTLDIDRRELLFGVEPVALEPRVFDLLSYLVANRDHVVTKDDVLDSVWSGRIVSESALTTRIAAARRAIGDTGQLQSLIGGRGQAAHRNAVARTRRDGGAGAARQAVNRRVALRQYEPRS